MPKNKRRLVHHNNTIGYWKGGAQGEPRKFQALTNFGLQLLKFIAAPPGLPESFKGYLVRVTQARRKGKGDREGYVLALFLTHTPKFVFTQKPFFFFFLQNMFSTMV